MSSLDAGAIRASLGKLATCRLELCETFAAIESTNSYLMRDDAPGPGRFRIALSDNQTAGRGRHGRAWRSPPGAGICLSVAYTFSRRPANLPALTLAIGLSLIDALERLGVGGIQLKWPNDLVAGDGKLGGILTESKVLDAGSIGVVAGVGLNVDLPKGFDVGAESGRAQPVADLAGLARELPSRNNLAAGLVDGLCEAFITYETRGFAAYASRWPQSDWLRGRALTIDAPQQAVSGVAAGIDEDGALLVDDGRGTLRRVTSGTVIVESPRGGDS